MIYKYFFICVLISSSLIVSCAKKEEEESLSSVAPLDTIVGTWVARCYDSGVISQNATTIITSSGSFTTTQNGFMQGDCTSPAFTYIATGSYVSGTSTINYGPVESGTIDWTFDQLDVTPNSSAGAAFLNSYTYCGFSNWASGTTKSIFGVTCGGVTYPAQGQTMYDIYEHVLDSSLVDYGIIPGDLMFGFPEAGHDGSSPSNRPQSLDASLLYQKQ